MNGDGPYCVNGENVEEVHIAQILTPSWNSGGALY
jgi:hypothetical protein